MSRTQALAFVCALAVFGGYAAKASSESSNSPSTPTVDWTIDMPACKRDMLGWQTFSPWNRLRQKGDAESTITRLTAQWRKDDAVDVTWVDIDGDGWCDVITSAHMEMFKNPHRMPVLLKFPRGIYLRTEHGFEPFKVGMDTSEYDGSSFTIYWDNVSKSAVIYKRIWQGNLVGGGGGDGGDEFHVRHMLRAMFAAQKANRDREAFDYFTEVDPFFYTHQMPHEVAKRIWNEEAERAGVDEAFPYLN
ncbi:hypothetical protein [Hydrogenophaga sp. T2]|uniref:hypothetical protein n=1 Tax=Hydrogenophaga sp. T2 TaxID=3132823 RepID=UPI003CF43050